MADVERLLSVNKKTVSPDRAALVDVTINDLRIVKDHVKVCEEPHKFRSEMDFFEHQERPAEFVPKRFLMKKRN